MKHGYPVKGSYKKTHSYVNVSMTAHGTVICLNPPIHTESTLEIINGPTLKHVVFLRNYTGKKFLLTQHFDRRCVGNAAVW
jgi:hypothetical protein